MATTERIMMTSIATAKALMTERRGRCTRLPRISLFMGDAEGSPRDGSSFHSSAQLVDGVLPVASHASLRGTAADHPCVWAMTGRTLLSRRGGGDGTLPANRAPTIGAMRVTTIIAT